MALSPSGSSKRDENYAIQAAATCLVDECATDLRNCRNYYQRHKVCELHSKSPQVSVKGQNLRFCQQCSRFHLLEEFDEGKRSCRKRLDGHNRRRRKPRPYIFSSRHGSNTLQFAGPQMHPTMAFTNPQLSSVGEAPTWVDHSKYAPSLLSCSGSPPHASSTTLTHAMNIQSDSGSVSTTASPLDPRLCYDGLENDIDLGWGSMTDMGSHYHASFDHQDPQTLPFFWQYQ